LRVGVLTEPSAHTAQDIGTGRATFEELTLSHFFGPITESVKEPTEGVRRNSHSTKADIAVGRGDSWQ
jgi:hypothetical protein